MTVTHQVFVVLIHFLTVTSANMQTGNEFKITLSTIKAAGLVFKWKPVLVLTRANKVNFITPHLLFFEQIQSVT